MSVRFMIQPIPIELRAVSRLAEAPWYAFRLIQEFAETCYLWPTVQSCWTVVAFHGGKRRIIANVMKLCCARLSNGFQGAREACVSSDAYKKDNRCANVTKLRCVRL